MLSSHRNLEYCGELMDFRLYDPKCISDKLLHFMTNPPVIYQFGSLSHSLILFLLDDIPHFIAEFIHSIQQLFFSLVVIPQIREFFREFVEAIDEFIHELLLRVCSLKKLNELRLHLVQTFEHQISLMLDQFENLETFFVVGGLKGQP